MVWVMGVTGVDILDICSVFCKITSRALICMCVPAK